MFIESHCYLVAGRKPYVVWHSTKEECKMLVEELFKTDMFFEVSDGLCTIVYCESIMQLIELETICKTIKARNRRINHKGIFRLLLK